MPEIAFIMGKSSSGKDRIFKELIADQQLQLKTVTLYTTRPMREGEKEGVEYHFVNDDTAQRMEQEKKIIEMRCYQTVYGEWKYFTADDGQINIKEGNYLMIGTLEAYEKLCDFYGKEHIMPIYIDVEDGIRLERALARERQQQNPKYAEMCRRFLADEKDFSEENRKRCGITKIYNNNGTLADIVSRIKTDIEQIMN